MGRHGPPHPGPRPEWCAATAIQPHQGLTVNEQTQTAQPGQPAATRAGHRIVVRTSNGKIIALEANQHVRQLYLSLADGHHHEHQLTFNHKTLPDFIEALLELSEYLELDAAAAGQGRLL